MKIEYRLVHYDVPSGRRLTEAPIDLSYLHNPTIEMLQTSLNSARLASRYKDNPECDLRIETREVGDWEVV